MVQIPHSNATYLIEVGNYAFNATLNTTDCHDGTTCPNAKNDTCCINKQGVSVVTYHNTRVIPSTVTALTSYYEAGGYTIPTTSAGASITELHAAPSSAPSAVPTFISTSSGLSSGAKAGIGVGVAVGAVAVAVLGFLLFRHYRKRRQYGQQHTPGYENMRHADGTLIAEAQGEAKHKMDGTLVAEAQGEAKHEIDGNSVRMGALKKHEIIPPRMEMDAASPERGRFHELDVPR